jgi:ribosome-binding protein aMBF1 (putative translation factor)
MIDKRCLCGRESMEGISIVYSGDEITLCEKCKEELKQKFYDLIIYGEVFIQCQ